MTEWAPATEAEAAMRDALRVDDQELYFRILSRTELLLPISSETIAGRAPMGWGTWTVGGRTHVLAFTSSEAMHACLAEHAGSARKIPYYELAAAWPNLEWWLAVNPGLPIEGYLPAWFISQLARGDVRLPGRSRQSSEQPERAETLGRVTQPPTQLARGLAARARVPVPQATPAGADRPMEPVGSSGRLLEGELVSAPRTEPAVTPPVTAPVPSAPPDRSPADSSPGGEPAGKPERTPESSADRADGAPGPDADPAATASGPADGQPSGAASSPPAGGPGPVEPPPTPEPIPDQSATDPAPADPASPDSSFRPANSLEEELLSAASGSQDSFLSVLLLAKVLLPVAEGADASVRPGDDGFVWRTDKVDNQPQVVVFTSPERLDEHMDQPVEVIPIRFVQLIRAWPDESWSLAVNPGTPIATTLTGSQIAGLVSSAAEVGLTDDAGAASESGAAVAAQRTAVTGRATVEQPIPMQKVVAPSQVGWYLERSYDRVSGFVHREQEVAHLRTPAKLVAGLGLRYEGSPFDPDADEVYVLRWLAYRPSLYRIPYGGRTQAAMEAMEGWVIERAPFRGNGFAPSDGEDVIAEFKVDSVRLPHGAQLWRLKSDGSSQLVALLDADGPSWRKVDGSGS
ncbi:MAG TPA: SseB family protein [Natronosporangium sp.]